MRSARLVWCRPVANRVGFWRVDELDPTHVCELANRCLSGAEPEVLAAHEEGFMQCFSDEYHKAGGYAPTVFSLVYNYEQAICRAKRAPAEVAPQFCG